MDNIERAKTNRLALFIKRGQIGEKCKVCGAKRKRNTVANLPLIQQHDLSPCCLPKL